MKEMTFADIRDVARFVFDENFPQMQQAARDEARRRVDVLMSELDAKMSATLTPEQLGNFRRPEIQHALNAAVQAAALRDDDKLRHILADLLCQRVKEESDFDAIVHTEAILTVGKLTPDLLNILALTVLVTRSRPKPVDTWNDIKNLFTIAFAPLLTFKGSASEVAHLAYCGCANVGLMGAVDGNFVPHFRKKFPILFGITSNESKAFDVEYKASIEKSKRLLLSHAPEYAGAIAKWDSPYLPMLNLTSVGHLLGKTHLETMAGISSTPDFEPYFWTGENLP